MKPSRASRSHASLALRIAIASAVFGLVVAGGAIFVGFWTLSRQMDERAAMEMEGRRELLVHILSTIPSIQEVGNARDRFGELFYGHDDLHLALVDPSTGRLLSSSSEFAAHSVNAIGHLSSPPNSIHAWRAPNGARFSGTHGMTRAGDGGAVEYFLSVDRHRDAGLLAGFIRATLLALPLLLVVVALGAGLIARTALAPLRRFNRLAASIGTQSLNQRLSLSGLPGEVEDMAVEFNNMLARIDEGYRQLEGFSGDLAHEMRTPVATLLGRTQVALTQTRTVAELRAVLEGNVEELERLSALISDMLFIARADHDATPLDTEPVELMREAERVVDYMSLVADEKNLRLEVTGTAPTFLADRMLVQRAITNLVSNALRHASPHSTVSIQIAPTETGATFSVVNEGEGIPPEHLERIFERFYRLDPGRSRGEGGSGLGLAIVRSIASLHKGRVSAVSDAGRTTFTVWLPTR